MKKTTHTNQHSAIHGLSVEQNFKKVLGKEKQNSAKELEMKEVEKKEDGLKNECNSELLKEDAQRSNESALEEVSDFKSTYNEPDADESLASSDSEYKPDSERSSEADGEEIPQFMPMNCNDPSTIGITDMPSTSGGNNDAGKGTYYYINYKF